MRRDLSQNGHGVGTSRFRRKFAMNGAPVNLGPHRSTINRGTFSMKLLLTSLYLSGMVLTTAVEPGVEVPAPVPQPGPGPTVPPKPTDPAPLPVPPSIPPPPLMPGLPK